MVTFHPIQLFEVDDDQDSATFDVAEAIDPVPYTMQIPLVDTGHGPCDVLVATVSLMNRFVELIGHNPSRYLGSGNAAYFVGIVNKSRTRWGIGCVGAESPRCQNGRELTKADWSADKSAEYRG